MNVPAVAEVYFLQSRHWWTQRARLSRTVFLFPQSGQTKAIRPAAPEQILRARLVVWEHLLELIGG